MAYNTSSRTGPTHSCQWFMDSVEAELFPKQKQVVDVTNSNSLSGFLTSSISGGETSSTFHPVDSKFSERLFDTEIARTINFGERNLSSGELGNIIMQRKDIEDSVESDFSFGLSMSNSLEDPRTGLNYGGTKRVKVSQVKDTENLIPSFFHTYNREDSSSLSVPPAFGKTDDNSVSMGLSFSKEDNCMMSIGNSFVKEDSNFIAMDQTHTNGGNEDTLIGPGYNDPSSIVSLNETLNKDECNIAKGAQTFESFDRTNLAVSQSLKMNNSVVSIGLPSSMDGCNVVPIGQTFNKGAEIAAYMDHTYNKTEDNSISMSKIYNKLDDNDLSIAYTCGKGESKIISFGGTAADDDINACEKLICSYDLLMGQSSVQKSEIGKGTMLIESNGDALIKATQITTTNIIFPKKREDQKVARKQTPNNFPSNVRSLLSTGILDGVPVKYIAWSQEKELRGTIKGSGYLCCCESCNYSKVINAYEFERHAGCKTKHPNNHIYFENGKTIYGIVQELRNTPQNILFDVIQTITGSPINQKSFRLWKESFLAATRELQRIYGTEEGKRLS